MILISVIIALAVVQLWGSGAPLHKDQWFYKLVSILGRQRYLVGVSGGVLFFILVIPLLALALALELVHWILPTGGELIILVPVLLYSLGRGDFADQVGEYLAAWRHRDSAHACNVLAVMRDSENELEKIVDWGQLHQRALKIFAYCGFERLFAVLFWFLLLGPGGGFAVSPKCTLCTAAGCRFS